MEKKVWSKEDVFRFISVYESKEELWNTKHRDHKNRARKAEILEEMSQDFSCSASEVMRKIHNLRNQMSQEVKKVVKRNSGCSNDIYSTNWTYFMALKFLVPFFTPDSTESNLLRPSISTEKKKRRKGRDNSECVDSPSSPPPPPPPPPPKRKKVLEVSDELYASACESLQKAPKDNQRFGEYVALELDSLHFDKNKRKLKSEIRKIVSLIADADDEEYNEINLYRRCQCFDSVSDVFEDSAVIERKSKQ